MITQNTKNITLKNLKAIQSNNYLSADCSKDYCVDSVNAQIFTAQENQFNKWIKSNEASIAEFNSMTAKKEVKSKKFDSALWFNFGFLTIAEIDSVNSDIKLNIKH